MRLKHTGEPNMIISHDHMFGGKHIQLLCHVLSHLIWKL
jgi:hypothetical protein